MIEEGYGFYILIK